MTDFFSFSDYSFKNYALQDFGENLFFLRNLNPQNNFLVPSSTIDFFYSSVSTDSDSVNKKNDLDLQYLNSKSDEFIQMLTYCDFEDGYSNDAIDFVNFWFKENTCATSLWIMNLYSQYTGTRRSLDSEGLIVSGILKILALINKSDYFSNLSDSFVPVFKTALREKNILIQEAALTVIERWHTEECISVLKDVCNDIDLSLKNYASNLIEKYLIEI